MGRTARFVREMLLGNLPYLKRSDRIGLIINLVVLAAILAVAATHR